VLEHIPPTPPDLLEGSSQEALERQEEFGDLSQAADNCASAREYYAEALERAALDDGAARVRLLLKLSQCDYRQGLHDSAIASFAGLTRWRAAGPTRRPSGASPAASP